MSITPNAENNATARPAIGPFDRTSDPWVTVARSLLSHFSQISTPCLLFDLDRLDRQIDLWFECMPDVQPHFAIKACDVVGVLKHLKLRGVSFDAATGGELDRLAELGIDGSQIVMTHPIRSEADLLSIATHRPRAIVVQTSDEVHKLFEAGIPGPGYSPLLFIRIALPYSNLNKFGVQCIVPMIRPEGGTTTAFDYRPLKSIFSVATKLAEQTGFAFSGFGFAGHVGTNTTSPSHYQHLLATFRILGQELRSRAGIRVNYFDLGGGYCDGLHADAAGVTQSELLRSVYSSCCRFKEEYGDQTTLIAEPGRFLVADSAAALMRAKVVSEAFFRAIDGAEVFEKHKVIHLDDGVYGNFMGQIHDCRKYDPVPFRLDIHDDFSGDGVACVMWGPTCDSFDRIVPPENYRVPADLRTGDYFLVDCMGAYSTVTATDFNQTQPTSLVVFRQFTDRPPEIAIYSSRSQLLPNPTP
jgi:ornithine decarboxylase